MKSEDNSKFEYFVQRTEKDLDEIKLKLDRLWDLRAMLIGAATVVSVISSCLVNIAFIYLDSHK